MRTPSSDHGSGCRTTDFLLIGGGIIGLAIAVRIQDVYPGASVVVLEKEQHLGAHASGRNSGVLHAGFYYTPDSLKARLTREGNALLHQFCDEFGLRVRRCGKVVVTTSSDQLPALDKLLERGEQNGVQVEKIDDSDLQKIEPRARTVGAALWSPTTSVGDPPAVLDALVALIERCGGHIRLGDAAVGQVRGGKILSTSGTWSAGHVINAAGLHADSIARTYGMCDDYSMLPFKGLYWYARDSAPSLACHIYPVPDPNSPFLGVHFTATLDGGSKIGPTAIPAFRREDYGRFPALPGKEGMRIVREYPRFLRSRQQDAGRLLRSEIPKYSRRYLISQARAMVPDACNRDYVIRGRPGVRAQLIHKASGSLEMDFVIRGDERSTHVLNAVSPAWTSSLSFARLVVGDMRQRLG